jgi:hypothetical protein
MSTINLNELRDRAYKIARDHGFHDADWSNEHLLCLVISELMEAVEADRNDSRANMIGFETCIKKCLSRHCSGRLVSESLQSRY